MTAFTPPTGSDFGSVITVPGVNVTGIDGATAASRYAGATNSGPPLTGNFLVGDYVVARNGGFWICTAAGNPGTWINVGAGSGVFAGEVVGSDFRPTGLTGATAQSRYVGATNLGPPAAGTFVVGDFVVDRGGTIHVCVIGGTPGTWADIRNPTFSTEVTGTDFKATGLTGALAASRYAGGTNSGPPTSGTFAVGDWVIDRTGSAHICTVAGSPGTWKSLRSPTFLAADTLSAGAVSAQGLTGATQASRYVGATNSGAPTVGTFAIGDYVIARDGALWVCVGAGTPGIWVNIVGGAASVTTLSVTGLPGATAVSRYVGATNSGPPVSGTFQVGDWIIDRQGFDWVCTVAGSPGTWTTFPTPTDPNFAGTLTVPNISSGQQITGQRIQSSGLGGATNGSRYVGATNSGSPATGTYLVGDYIIDRTGDLWICTVAGTPGTWTRVGFNRLLANMSVASIDTREGTSSTTYTDLASVGPTVSVNVVSGRMKVTQSCLVENANAGATSLMSFAFSGANVIAAADRTALSVYFDTAASAFRLTFVRVFTALNNGVTQVQSKYRVTTGTGFFAERDLIVEV